MTIPQDVIDDLCSRFIINIPQEERKDVIRVCFHIELAHWFYIDYYCTEANSQLPKVQFKEFARIIFSNVPFLQQHQSDLDRTIERWRDYKMAVPTYGAILLDKDLDNVLLVQGFWARSSWGFPKGKVNADEDPVVCACREVLEETGYDCSSAISAKDYIELHIQDTLIRLYIVTGVDKETIFKPMTRCEIKNCNWFKISDLPMTRKDNVKIENKALKSSAFFMTIPFIKPLRKWINRRRNSLNLINGEVDMVDMDLDCSAVIEEGISSSLSKRHRECSTVIQEGLSSSLSNRHRESSARVKESIPPSPLLKRSQDSSSVMQESILSPLSRHPRDCSSIVQEKISSAAPRRIRLWSSTWENVKIDWSEIMSECVR